jgi:hypothetical protein
MVLAAIPADSGYSAGRRELMRTDAGALLLERIAALINAVAAELADHVAEDDALEEHGT